jgi:2-C-methyl-D-erythritol 4-phosphate cytidylyltransferase
MKYWAIIPAAGAGSRMAQDDALPKQYLEINDRTLLEHSLIRLDSTNLLAGIVVVLNEDDTHWQSLTLEVSVPVITATGGKERVHSVLNGLAALESLAAKDDWVIVHDAARPCIRPQDVAALIHTLSDTGVGGLLAMPVNDTIKQAGADMKVSRTLDRKRLWRAATPQMFRLGLLNRALVSALANDDLVTDEAQAMENAGFEVSLMPCSSDNIKVTYPEDLAIAEQIQVMQGESSRS